MKSKFPTKGDIVPAYTDHHTRTGFMGMIRLIEKQDPVIFDPNQVYYIKEADNRLNSNYKKGNPIGYKKRNQRFKCEVLKVGVNQLTLLYKDKEFVVEKPYEDKIIDLFNEGEFIKLEEDNFQKTWVVVKDSFDSSTLVTYKDYMENKDLFLNSSDWRTKILRNKEVKEIRKPFNYNRDPQEPMSSIYKSERWLVEYLSTPFLSSLQAGDDVWYKDEGLHRVISVNGSKVLIYKPETKLELSKEPIIAESKNLYINKTSHTTHKWISYYLTKSNKWHTDPFDKIEEDNFLDTWETNEVEDDN